jgi:hypothetical protein
MLRSRLPADPLAVSSPLGIGSARDLASISRASAQIVGAIPPEPPPLRFVVELSYPERPRVAPLDTAGEQSPISDDLLDA